MGRILCIDYGTKKCGIAVTDPLRIIATGLTTVRTHDVLDFLATYFSEEEVDAIVIGEPLLETGEPAQIHHAVVGFRRKLEKLYPRKSFHFCDERYSSQRAEETIRQVVTSKKKRRDKMLVDKISAVLILQDFMNEQGI